MTLDWRAAIHFAGRSDDPHLRPCVLCPGLTPLRSHAGEPVHKVCAEDWAAAHPSETRFVTDAQPRKRTR